MLPSWVWVVVGIAAYAVIVEVLDRLGYLPDYLKVSGPLTTIHTQRGKEFLGALSDRFSGFWGYWGDFGIVLSLVVMVGAVLSLGQSAISILLDGREQVISNPENMLVIPGVNDFLPLSATPEIVLGLAIGLIVHEGGHGLYCRHGDINIESLGLVFLSVIPLGAFVEPDEDDRKEADLRSQVRMFAAGVTNNFAISILLLVLLFGPLSHAFAPAAGMAVGGAYPDTPAQEAGFEKGDLITAVDGQPVANASEYYDALEATDDESVQLTLKDGETKTVDRELIISRVVVHGDVDFGAGSRVAAVNGTNVTTTAGFAEEVEGRERISLTTGDGETTDMWTGAYVSRASSDGPLASAGAPDDNFLIVGFDGEQITSTDALVEALDGASPGEQVTVQTRQGDTVETHTVTLGGDDGDAYLGVDLRDGVNGVSTVDVGVDPYPAEQMLTLVQGEGGLLDFGRYIIVLLLLPLLAVIEPSIGYNFAGFVGVVPNFYTVTGPLAAFGGGAFTMFNIAFWTAWINIQLGFFNTIPTYPLDGGHILRASFQWVADRAPFEVGDNVVTQATRLVSAVSIGILVAIIFG